MKLGRHIQHESVGQPEGPPALELDAAELTRLNTVFAAPVWLRNLGRTSWLLVGVLLVIVGLIWLLAETAQITNPVTVAMVVAVVTSPLVRLLDPHMPRALAAVIVLVSIVAIAVLVMALVVAGIFGQHDQIAANAGDAVDKAQSWLQSLGVDKSGASQANAEVSKTVPEMISTLVHGIISGISGIASAVFGLSLAALSLFFLLKDGPSMREWVERHVGVPQNVAHTIVGGVIRSLRGYFRGVTLVAAFNGVVVFIGALILGVPLAGTIGIVTFVTAYVPFIGAFVAGAFAVILALGAKGTTTALIMLVIVILANGLLQNIVQPFAMGAALSLNPLVVLVVTIGAGSLFGTVGLILAAPLVSAAVHITRDLSAARAAAQREADAFAAAGTPALE